MILYAASKLLSFGAAKLNQNHSTMHHFQKLEVWGMSMTLSYEIHEATKKFPKNELYGITSQMRRASVSIPSSIAEGSGRKSEKEFLECLYMANGSAYELYTQIILAFKANYIDEDSKNNLLNKLSSILKKLFKLIQKLSKI